MKKHNLLGAIALSTIAVSAAGAANAQQYSLAVSGDAKLTTATVKAAVSVASEVKLDAATNAKGIVGLALTPSTGAILPGGNSILTFTLTGAHTFGTAVTPGAIVAGANCAPTTTVSSGGAATSNTVSFLVSNLSKCDSTNPILVELPVLLANTTTALGVDSQFTTELKTPIDGGSKSVANVVKFAPAFSVEVKADATATAATLKSGFKDLTTNVALGTVEVKADTALFKGIQTGAAKVVATEITSGSFKFAGSQSAAGASLKFGGNAVDTATGTIVVAGPVAKGAQTVDAVKGTGVITASTYTVATTLTVDTAYNAPATFGPTALQNVTREGSTYLIPWVASGTLATSNGNATVVRIANIGTADTGAVSAELLSSSTSVPTSTSLVPLATAITKGKDFVITGADLQTKIGADFGRGDIRITVEALPGDLVARRFLQNVANGSVTEVSLGRSEITPATPGNVVSEPVN